MKRASDFNILNDLAEQLEETLNKAKKNDLCHLIKPIEDAITKVKELNKGREVKYERTDECNCKTADFEMACVCDEWGPDTLGPDGKWFCKMCGENCSCDLIWNSSTEIPRKKISRKADFKKSQKGADHLTIELKAIECPSESKDNEFNKTNSINKKILKVSEKDVIALYDPRLYSTVEKIDHVESNDKISNSQDKCKNCKCIFDKKGKKIKTEECRAASNERKKFMLNCKNEEIDTKGHGNEQKEILKTEVSNSSCHHCDRKDILQVVIPAKKGKCGIVECKSSSLGLLKSLKDSKDQRCGQGMKDYFSESVVKKGSEKYEKPEKPLKCSEISGRETEQFTVVGPEIVREKGEEPQIPGNRCLPQIRSVTSVVHISVNRCEDVKTQCENFVKSTKRTTGQKSDQKHNEPIENSRRRRGLCNKSPSSTRKATSADLGSQCSRERSERMKKKTEMPEEHMNCLENSTQTVPPGTLRRQRLQAEKMQCSSHERKEILKKPERKTLDHNFQDYKCNYCHYETNIEKLCSCGCGYFTEGVSTTRPCSGCNSLNNQRQEGAPSFKKYVSRSQKCDCEGSCEWCK